MAMGSIDFGGGGVSFKTINLGNWRRHTVEKGDKTCPHCRKALVRWEPCAHTGWGHDLFYCDNNACSYFLEGRRKIACEYEKNFAYRYCYDPAKGRALPIIAWCGGDLSLLKGRCGKGRPRGKPGVFCEGG